MVVSSIGYLIAAQDTMTVKPIFNRFLTQVERAFEASTARVLRDEPSS